MHSCYRFTKKMEELEETGESLREDVLEIKAWWITFEFGRLF